MSRPRDTTLTPRFLPLAELIAGFFPISTLSSPSASSPILEIIPLPLGTANALYHTLHPPSSPSTIDSPPDFLSLLNPTPETLWSLRSLLSYLLESTPRPLPLPLTLTTLTAASPSPETTTTLLTHIVLSTAMHASLLARSEAFRAEFPGVERFKMAAEQVLSLPFPGRLKLLPPSSALTSSVLRYSPASKTFTPLLSETELLLRGPFAYVLSSTLVSRLERDFVISPLIPSAGRGTMDLIVLRPGRSRSVKEGDAEEWERVVRGVMGGAYKGSSRSDAWKLPFR